ncbi:MAG: molybdate ABC transporter substrate-binding protein [Roseobacter sp.]
MGRLAPEAGLRDIWRMRILHRFKRLLWVLTLATGLPTLSCAGELTVFAAASLKEALDEVTKTYESQTGHRVTTSFAGSSALARQIELGAPADIFVSASPDWMDHLEAAGQLQAGTRVDLLSNRMVLIGPALPRVTLDLQTGTDLTALLGEGPLAMALTKAVPAGIYGKEALSNLGLWDQVAAHVAETDNVRAALALVALGAAPLGVVYATDAQADPRVSLISVFPQSSHSPIVYPVAAIGPNARAEALSFLEFLSSDIATVVFQRHGFTRVEG